MVGQLDMRTCVLQVLQGKRQFFLRARVPACIFSLSSAKYLSMPTMHQSAGQLCSSAPQVISFQLLRTEGEHERRREEGRVARLGHRLRTT